ncbi:MAG TPA: AzlC family ABC transporter permease [Actinoplanes sp.]|nr:AzlC family ABC transporter permease [Actinoplanes sp.]
MRTVSRTRDRALLRDAVAIAAAMIAVGGSFGAITIAYGLPTWVPFLMSTVVFAGGAQFLAVGLIAAGNPIAAVLAGLLLNARHLPFGLAVARTVGPRWRDRLIGSHLMTDETVAFTLREKDPTRRRHTYWLIGITLFTSWNAGTALGVWLGGATGDPATLGLDAAFPAGLIALIMPSLHDRDTRLVALAGAAIAVVLTPVLPAGLPVLCALLGLFALFVPRRRVRSAGEGGARTGAAGAGAVEAGPTGACAIEAGAAREGAVEAGPTGAGGTGSRTASGAAVDREEAPC